MSYNPHYNKDMTALEREAYTTDNKLALAIFQRHEEIVEMEIERALTKNDADYSYDIFDAVHAVEYLMFSAEWEKQDILGMEDKIVYRVSGIHEDRHPHHNDIILFRSKGSDYWTIEAHGGEYGEDVKEESFYAKGYKDAQDKATKRLISMIKMGLELNLYV